MVRMDVDLRLSDPSFLAYRRPLAPRPCREQDDWQTRVVETRAAGYRVTVRALLRGATRPGRIPASLQDWLEQRPARMAALRACPEIPPSSFEPSEDDRRHKLCSVGPFEAHWRLAAWARRWTCRGWHGR